ncbi:unnamed protein product [Amoebophrya sp. A120]|nr:unnamed protein product [Amoebophrya sp. A120]|eukprot:GSA120T00021002001.1
MPPPPGRAGANQRDRVLEQEDADLIQIPKWLREHELVSRDFVLLFHNRYTHRQVRKVLLSLLWLAGAAYFRSQIYIIFSGIGFIFLSLGARAEDDDGVSAYSVFNRGARHLLGDLRPDQIDRENRGVAHMGGGGGNGGGGLGGDFAGAEQMKSKDANKPCACGSGKKTKKCCGAVR